MDLRLLSAGTGGTGRLHRDGAHRRLEALRENYHAGRTGRHFTAADAAAPNQLHALWTRNLVRHAQEFQPGPRVRRRALAVGAQANRTRARPYFDLSAERSRLAGVAGGHGANHRSARVGHVAKPAWRGAWFRRI